MIINDDMTYVGQIVYCAFVASFVALLLSGGNDDTHWQKNNNKLFCPPEVILLSYFQQKLDNSGADFQKIALILQL